MKNYTNISIMFLFISLSGITQIFANTPVLTHETCNKYYPFIILLAFFSILIYVLKRKYYPTKMELLIQEILTCSEYSLSILDDDMNLIYMNPKTMKILATDQNLTLPQPLRSVFPFGAEHEFLKTIEKLVKDKIANPTSPFIFKTQLGNSKDDANFGLYLVSLRSYSSKNLQKKVYILAMLNVEPKFILAESLQTALVKAEENIEELKNIDRLKSEFLAICSHELKTPLVSIMGYLNLMSAEKLGNLSEKQSKALGISLKNVTHLDSLITSMLNYARMDAGKLDFYISACDINMIIVDAIDALRPIALEKNIALKYVKNINITKVLADYGLIYRVLLNLIGNSIKFSDDSAEILVSIDTSDTSKHKILVQDFGKGIPASKIDEIKMPFVQVEREDNGSRKGLGLGLAICEKILLGHGTTLEIKSEEGKGTVTSFDLNVDNVIS